MSWGGTFGGGGGGSQGKRPPRPRRPPIVQLGPNVFRFERKDPVQLVGMGDPPAGFVGAQNSAEEWPIYAACAIITGCPKDYQRGPFNGCPGTWYYQFDIGGGRRQRGGSVIDFVINWLARRIGLRVQSEYWHIFTNARQQAIDRLLRTRGSEGMDVYDLYTQNYIGDRTGRAAIMAVKRALQGEREPNPLASGQAVRAASAWEAKQP